MTRTIILGDPVFSHYVYSRTFSCEISCAIRALMFVINNGVQTSSRPRTRIAECLGFDYCKSVDLNRADFECDCLFVRWGRPGFISYWGQMDKYLQPAIFHYVIIYSPKTSMYSYTYNPSIYCWLYISLIFMVSG